MPEIEPAPSPGPEQVHLAELADAALGSAGGVRGGGQRGGDASLRATAKPCSHRLPKKFPRRRRPQLESEVSNSPVRSWRQRLPLRRRPSRIAISGAAGKLAKQREKNTDAGTDGCADRRVRAARLDQDKKVQELNNNRLADVDASESADKPAPSAGRCRRRLPRLCRRPRQSETDAQAEARNDAAGLLPRGPAPRQ